MNTPRPISFRPVSAAPAPSACGGGAGPGPDPKHAWHAVPRVEPQKRPAAERRGDFHEVYQVFDEDLARQQASRCIQCGDSPCLTGCPLGNPIAEFLELMADGKFLEAAALFDTTSNMPEICGRVCPQERLCESACLLGQRSDPIPVGALEVFAAEYAFAHGAPQGRPAPANGHRVAVVGSGPAGLACADELAKRGYAVTVLEAQPVIGGLLATGFPGFKLEPAVLERRLEVLRRRGVSFRVNTLLGRDLSLEDLYADYDAVFLGMGAQRPRWPRLPGVTLAGVQEGLAYLCGHKLGAASNAVPLEVRGRRVVVLGGGDTAVDCLRTALRAGALSATCLCRSESEALGASRRDYLNALEEGARFVFRAEAVALLADEAGRVARVRCVRTSQPPQGAVPGDAARVQPGPAFSLPAEAVLLALGFEPMTLPTDSDWSGIEVNESHALAVDEHQMTSLPRVFSGGDQTQGASLVVHAVRDGRKAAEGIDRYLQQRHPARGAAGR